MAIRQYWVEMPDGEVKKFTSKRRFRNEIPLKGGTVKLGQGTKAPTYTVDPRKFRRFYKRSKITGLLKETQIQYYRWNDPTPLDFFLPENEVKDDRTGQIITILSRSNRLRRLLGQGFDWTAIILGAGVGLAAGLILARYLPK